MCESVVSGGPVCVLVHQKRPTDNLPPLLQVELALHVVAPRRNSRRKHRKASVRTEGTAAGPGVCEVSVKCSVWGRTRDSGTLDSWS